MAMLFRQSRPGPFPSVWSIRHFASQSAGPEKSNEYMTGKSMLLTLHKITLCIVLNCKTVSYTTVSNWRSEDRSSRPAIAIGECLKTKILNGTYI